MAQPEEIREHDAPHRATTRRSRMHPPLCCERVEILMEEYLENDLPRPLHDQVYSHVRACVECWSSVQQLRDTVTYLSSVPRLRSPRSLRHRLIAAVRRSLVAPF